MLPCIHELPAGQCSYCKPKPKYNGPWWDAMYETMCESCGQVIGIGERVRWDDEGVKTIHAKHK